MSGAGVGTWLGVVISLAGFTVTIVQLHRTKSAAERAVAAVRETEEKLARNSLLVLIPQMLTADSDLATTMSGPNPENAIRHMVAWRHAAAQVKGLVELSKLDEPILVALIAEAVGLAAVAEQAVIDARTSPPPIRKARAAITNASTEAAALLARLQSYTEDYR